MMSRMMKSQIRTLTLDQIAEHMRHAARLELDGKELSWERAANLVAIAAIHGDLIADMLSTTCPSVSAAP
jgi:hypothetical protein